MLELLGNACQWTNTRVKCSLLTEGQAPVFNVKDDGPGCSIGEIADITGRGVRLDEDVSGHGLGLAIAKEIVEGYQRQMSLSSLLRARRRVCGGQTAGKRMRVSPRRVAKGLLDLTEGLSIERVHIPFRIQHRFSLTS